MHVYNNYYYKNLTYFFLLYIRMNGKNVSFDDKKIEKN